MLLILNFCCSAESKNVENTRVAINIQCFVEWIDVTFIAIEKWL